jgi:nitric oxide reductase NorE protein
MKTSAINHKNFYYPPGGILLWLIVFLELITFGIALIVMVVYSKDEPALFHTSRLSLNPVFGALNTFVLLSSGFFMITSLTQYKEGNTQKSSFYLKLTILFGCLFVLVKSIEYYIKIKSGISLSTNTFFTFYWLLTLFHLVHVLFGLIILTSFCLKISKQHKEINIEDFEAGSTFWHMCDLIWLLIFPLLYLFF